MTTLLGHSLELRRNPYVLDLNCGFRVRWKQSLFSVPHFDHQHLSSPSFWTIPYLWYKLIVSTAYFLIVCLPSKAVRQQFLHHVGRHRSHPEDSMKKSHSNDFFPRFPQSVYSFLTKSMEALDRDRQVRINLLAGGLADNGVLPPRFTCWSPGGSIIFSPWSNEKSICGES